VVRRVHSIGQQSRCARAVRLGVLGCVASCCVAACTKGSELEYWRGQSGSEVAGNGGSSGTDVGGGQNPGSLTSPCPCSFPLTNESVAFAHDPRTTAALRVTLLARELQSYESRVFSWCSQSREPAPEPTCARVRLRVEEVLAGEVPLAVGDELEADTDGLLPCYAGTDDVKVGEQALAQASWLSPDVPDGGQSLPLSANALAIEGSVRLTRWEERILFAATEQAELRVPASELGVLSGPSDACFMRFGDWSRLPGVPEQPGG
jgi:hypothetical protein